MSEHTAWVTSARLEASGGTFFTVLFWIWGIFGLLINTVNFLAATGAVGVGTSAYLTVGMLYWIGGMMLFGIGALNARSSYDFRRPG
jgi:hypothetical protein